MEFTRRKPKSNLENNMSSADWQQNLAMLDAKLKYVATEWLRQVARNSATTNVQLNEEFRQTFLQISNDR